MLSVYQLNISDCCSQWRKTWESLQWPPPVSSCVLTIMVTLSLWELYLWPQWMYEQEGQKLLDAAVIYKHRLMVSKKIFSPCLSSYLDVGMAGAQE